MLHEVGGVVLLTGFMTSFFILTTRNHLGALVNCPDVFHFTSSTHTQDVYGQETEGMCGVHVAKVTVE